MCQARSTKAGHGLCRIGGVEQRHPGQQRQGRRGDGRVVGVQAHHRPRAPAHTRLPATRGRARGPGPMPCQHSRRASGRSPAPMRCATSVVVAFGQGPAATMKHQRHQVHRDLVPGHGGSSPRRAMKQRHEDKAGHFHQDGQPHRQPQLQQRALGRQVGARRCAGSPSAKALVEAVAPQPTTARPAAAPTSPPRWPGPQAFHPHGGQAPRRARRPDRAQLSGSFSPRPASCRPITALGPATPRCLKPRYAVNSSARRQGQGQQAPGSRAPWPPPPGRPWATARKGPGKRQPTTAPSALSASASPGGLPGLLASLAQLLGAVQAADDGGPTASTTPIRPTNTLT